MLKGKKILLGVSGGIAAYKVCYLVRYFVKEGAEVKVIMTPSATKFVSPVTLSALSKNEVLINLLPQDDPEKSETVDTQTWHVNLGLWADIFVIAPATANTIAKIVHGESDNFLLATVLSARCPIVIAPTMDDDMYNNEVTQDNIKSLKKLGYKIIDPESGELASGLIGIGRMAEPETIFEFVKNELSRQEDLKGKKVLVTAGPTLEYIDAVRFITNHSSGKMGFAVARAAKERGADVTLVTGKVNLDDIQGVKRVDVETAEEMLDAVKENMSGADIIIMTAAVEDFKPLESSASKIKKEGQDKFTFEFGKSPDILDYLGKNKAGYKLVGFAMETDNGEANARDKFERKNLDLIVLNNPNTEGAGFGTDTNVVTFIDKDDKEELPLMSKYEVANKIIDKFVG
ncbi:MAG: bifunctional phosphopantothenoylcysteine decarboxylase/phosphopantothenate--cysteine ligase CoaBC [Ignavibacteriae bacterium]|nr:bifunctional phosphopantothenoylcysteine decarboxylase/phosphopantothenate--cysteine ligase CoaBC [Ignavibacteriota bacterium]MCB9242583.1 bifunctional phosphopantothenoylcysteine decarboxylase/phosphopantothenate--cysteine ligase CoaBC [Ignavibacteriales bacterium]